MLPTTTETPHTSEAEDDSTKGTSLWSILKLVVMAIIVLLVFALVVLRRRAHTESSVQRRRPSHRDIELTGT
eukprot:symbB.v1.2.017762.t1/scaffold1355.1/size123688/4